MVAIKEIMWNWFKNKKRTKLLSAPFPQDWETIIFNNLPYYKHLPFNDKKELQNLVRIFIAEKDWLGCNGLILTNEIKVTIASHACLLILKLPHDYYRNITSIYVYPSTVVIPETPVGIFEVRTLPIQGPMPILGQAFSNGPVILVWDAIQREARHPERGHNVVYHEFAHKLDMLDGIANGTPPLLNKSDYQKWSEICTQEYTALIKRLQHHKDPFFDSYAATNEAEFFAVITEYFFSKPEKMKKYHGALYKVLKSFYRQDPAMIKARTYAYLDNKN